MGLFYSFQGGVLHLLILFTFFSRKEKRGLGGWGGEGRQWGEKVKTEEKA